MRRQNFGFQIFGALLIFCMSGTVSANDGNDQPTTKLSENQTFMEVVGQNNLFDTTPQQSRQVGYLSRFFGTNSIFSSDTVRNETTAELTFLNDVVRTQVNVSGPMFMVQRDGTFALYRNFAPANFADLSSFASGTPVLTGTSHQQVTLDTTSSTFSVYTDVTVTSSAPFSLGGHSYRVAKPGDTFRIYFYGHSAATDMPSAWFGGYAVATGR